jgi:hypothetical protein
MNNFSKSQEQQLDDQLSEFTDQVLSGENEANMQDAMNHDELVKLQKTVLRMKAAAQTARTNNASNARIRARLLAEWKNSMQAERQSSKRFNWNWSLPRLALAGGFIALIIFGATTLFAPTTTPLMGTADGSQTWSPFFILAGIVIIVFLLWHNRHNKK